VEPFSKSLFRVFGFTSKAKAGFAKESDNFAISVDRINLA
jgi:hypothetical protein